MTDINLSLTGTQIDDALLSVHSPDTTPTASSAKMVTSNGVKTYVDAQIAAQIPRPFYVDCTGSTSGSSNPSVNISGAVNETTYTYTISEFTSSDTRFDTTKLTDVFVHLQTHPVASSGGQFTLLYYRFPTQSGNGTSSGDFISLGSISQVNVGNFHTRDLFRCPINPNQTTIELYVQTTLSLNFVIEGFIQYS